MVLHKIKGEIMKILVGSKNPGKIQGVKEAFELFFEDVDVVGFNANSEVPEQPINEQTMLGAKNRVKNLKKHAEVENISADYFVAVESGLVNIYGEEVIINACYIENACGQNSVGFSEGFPIPNGKFEDIKNKGFGRVFDETFKIDHDPNKPKVMGGINTLTNGKISRIRLTSDAVVMALTKFLHEEWV